MRRLVGNTSVARIDMNAVNAHRVSEANQMTHYQAHSGISSRRRGTAASMTPRLLRF